MAYRKRAQEPRRKQAFSSKHRARGFVLCICNGDYEASLELRKVYQAIPDTGAARHHLLRVIDESGEDYLYPQDFFLPIELPKAVEKALLAVDCRL
jgi:hypothetical protein